jgi:hypothetical protein
MNEWFGFLGNAAVVVGVPLVVLLVAGVVARALRWARNFDATADVDGSSAGGR